MWRGIGERLGKRAERKRECEKGREGMGREDMKPEEKEWERMKGKTGDGREERGRDERAVWHRRNGCEESVGGEERVWDGKRENGRGKMGGEWYRRKDR